MDVGGSANARRDIGVKGADSCSKVIKVIHDSWRRMLRNLFVLF